MGDRVREEVQLQWKRFRLGEAARRSLVAMRLHPMGLCLILDLERENVLMQK